MMNFAELIIDNQLNSGVDNRVFGVVIGIVTNNQDPDKMGRVKVKFPWLSDKDESHWARIATPMAGKKIGIYFLPEVDDEVLVMFEHGDVRFPYIIGALWNGKDVPPETNSDGKNNIRLIKSRSGHTIRLNDEKGKETIEIIDKSQKNSIKIDTATNSITITAGKDIKLSAPNGSIELDAKTIDIKSGSDTTITAGTGIDINAKLTMNIKGQFVNIN